MTGGENTILDLLYPGRCPVCGEILPYGRKYVCGRCEPKLSYVSQPVCMKCGKELEKLDNGWNGGEYCADCIRHPKDFAGGIALLNYNAAAQTVMARLKYQNKREGAEFLAAEMAKRHGRQLLRLRPDALVPVPIHKARLKLRGYNQSELLAKALGRRLGISVRTDLLFRVENTKAQKQLGYEERQKNEAHAFRTSGKTAVRGTLILVDDIYTTGATAQSCAAVLLKAGAEQVYLANMAVGYGR
ncbi:ComF family protein [Lacrimispora sp. NSJ-141]|uniref:ComF family protein n=1 Tax=Lientehia hominis TaxID=2897778 RepID=A0AAP2RJ20_9FIRM|nr:ComF family protein [Lientehia hominis]